MGGIAEPRDGMYRVFRTPAMRRFAGVATILLTTGSLALLGTQLLSRSVMKQTTPSQSSSGNADGFTDTPMLPGLPWHVHDPRRPHPPVVTPGATPTAAPSDAMVLFDGRDLSRWVHHETGPQGIKLVDAKWMVRDGYFETGEGNLYTRAAFGDVQLHVEWSSPSAVAAGGQERGNSGIFLMGMYEIQILDSYNNKTYADGESGAIYGQWPPLINAARKPGEWQTYDIVFEAPRFEKRRPAKPAFLTVFWNGVAVHNRKAVLGPTVHRDVAKYSAPHAEALPLMLQDHGNPVRYRNIWIRRLRDYDQPEK